MFMLLKILETIKTSKEYLVYRIKLIYVSW